MLDFLFGLVALLIVLAIGALVIVAIVSVILAVSNMVLDQFIELRGTLKKIRGLK